MIINYNIALIYRMKKKKLIEFIIVFQDAHARVRIHEVVRASNAPVNARRNDMREESH